MFKTDNSDESNGFVLYSIIPKEPAFQEYVDWGLLQVFEDNYAFRMNIGECHAIW